jgi:LysR family transcriptional activator of mexEF-oprN operon
VLDAYLNANHVRVSYDGRRGFIDDMFERVGHTRKVIASFSHFAGVLSTLAASDVIATLPTFAATTYAQMTGLTTCPVPLPVPSFRCFTLWENIRHNEPHHLWLRQFISEVVQKSDTTKPVDSTTSDNSSGRAGALAVVPA